MASQLEQAPLSEQVILAWILFHPSDFSEVAAKVEEDYFYSKAHQELFVRMAELVARGLYPDFYAVSQESSMEKLMEYGDLMTTLPGDLWLSIHIKHDTQQLETHIEMLREAYLKRETALALMRGESAEQVMSRLSALASKGSDRASSGEDIASLVFAQINEDEVKLPLPFGLMNNALSGGIRQGEMMIVGGRQGAGKSVFLQNAALHALENDKRVLFVTAEMGGGALGARWASMLSRQKISRGEVVDLVEANRALGEMSEWGDRLVVLEITSVAAIEVAMKRAQFDLVCVDYLQKLSAASQRAKSEYERVSEVSRMLDNLCQRFQVPMLAAAQFNRRAEGQQPSIADLRDSGQIEADADVVISLWQKPEDTAKPQSKLYFDILKNRNGYTLHNSESSEYALWFDKPHFRLFDIDKDACMVE